MNNGQELAFPFIEEAENPSSVNFGLTKREYFAAMAMQGMLSAESEEFNFSNDAEGVAEYAVQYADALLNVLRPRSAEEVLQGLDDSE